MSLLKKVFKIGLIILWLEIFLSIGGFIFDSCQSMGNELHLWMRPGSYRALCVGDSMTGYGLYPQQLELALNARAHKTSFVVINKGLMSATTEDIAAKLPQWVAQYHPQAVLVMAGIDDRFGQETPSAVTQGITAPPTQPTAPALTHGGLLKKSRIYALGENLFTRLRTSNRQEIKFLEYSYRFFKVKLHPDDPMAWYQLWLSYLAQGQDDKAAEAFSHISDPHVIGDDLPWVIYRLVEQKKYQDAAYLTDILIKYRKNSSNINNDLVERMAYAYFKSNRLESEETLYRWALKDNPSSSALFINLGKVLQRQQRYQEAEDAFNQYLALNAHLPGTLNRVYDSLLSVYREQGKSDEAVALKKKMSMLYTQNKHYQQIQDFLAAQHIKMVAVQYPLLSLEELERKFNPAPGTILVENRLNFLKAKSPLNHYEFFTDYVTSDFGHLTLTGARLMADQVAQAMLQDQ